MNWRLSCLLPVAALLLAGCGTSTLPPLGKVQGTITLDGAALANAIVSFQAEDGKGRQSCGTTDAAGHYELVYLRNIRGAKMGKHHVVIQAFAPQDPEKEILPTRYNTKTELEADVQQGENPPLDFQLSSQ